MAPYTGRPAQEDSIVRPTDDLALIIMQRLFQRLALFSPQSELMYEPDRVINSMVGSFAAVCLACKVSRSPQCDTGETSYT